MNLAEMIWDYIAAGGFVMPPLLLLTLVLWYALGYRFAIIVKAGHTKNIRHLINKFEKGKKANKQNILESAISEAYIYLSENAVPIRKYLDSAFWPLEVELSRYQVLIKTIVSIAPLLGLLGTVAGMIETFDSLQSMELFSQSGGIAGGISQALITTQYGLAVAIPGLLVNGYLNRRKHQIEIELNQIKDLMSAKQAEI